MMLLENESSINICTSLFWRLSSKGLESLEINRLVKDVFNLLKDGGSFTIAFVNYELTQLGWADGIMDEPCFEHIVLLLENEFDYKVCTRDLH